MRAAQTALQACDVEIKDLKLLHEEDQDLAANLKTQRDEAYAAAENAAAPGVPWYVPALIGLVAGAAGTAYLIRGTR